MTRKLKHIALMAAAVATLLMQSCRVAPTDNDLDAQWQLLTVETPAQTITPDNPRLYFSFYRHTANLTTSNGKSVTANLTYVKKTSVTLKFPGLTYADLTPWYIADLTDPSTAPAEPVVVFSVDKLNSNRLILTDQLSGYIYTFRKF